MARGEPMKNIQVPVDLHKRLRSWSEQTKIALRYLVEKALAAALKKAGK